MGIDIKTIVLILGITHLMQVLVFLYQYKANKNIAGPGWWLLWSAFESFAFVLILLRNIPELLPQIIILQNIILLAGTIFIYIGILRFFGKKVNLKFLIPFFLTFLIIHFYFIFVHEDISIRSVNISIFLSAISFITAFSIYRHKPESTVLTSNFNISLFIVHGLIFAYRALMISLGAPVNEIFEPNFFNFLPYFDSLIVSLLWTFGFIMMLNQRLTAEINESKIHFELIFNHSPDGAIIHRAVDGLGIDCNESLTKITGYSKEEILGDPYFWYKVWESPKQRVQLIQKIREQGFCENFEAVFQRKDGQFFTGLISAKELSLKGIPHIFAVTRDISERKRFESELKSKNEELNRLNIEKDRFFSIISHDLRSPFNSLLGLSGILVEEIADMTEEQIREISVSIRNSLTNLYRLLENLLEWSVMEQGSFHFNPENIKLPALIDESLILVGEFAKAKNIQIMINIQGDFAIVGDKNILQMVIRNLVSNAVKFTPRDGQIEISAETIDDKAVIIKVKDSGIGMDPTIVNNLFNFNNQINRKGTENEASTGLGLVLCKMLIEKHNGKLWAESEVGNGSVFYVSIPVNNELQN
jgi:PAS domain S-box-containing protein